MSDEPKKRGRKSGGSWRSWTDEEMGYMLSTIEQSAAEAAAHLDRPYSAVVAMRHKLRSGWSKKKDYWTALEDEILTSSAQKMSNVALAALMPGRSARAVARRRERLGILVGGNRRNDPFSVGERSLIAKTCSVCGLLLPGAWFHPHKIKGKFYMDPNCKQCHAGRMEGRVRPASQRAWVQAAQELTIASAYRSGQEYTESDHAIMSDPTTTNLSKALAMNRTYSATCSAVSNNGYASNSRLGDPAHDQWLIDNPNAERVEEITASLNERELVSAGGRPDFEWDD